jgi:hypothetical protein
MTIPASPEGEERIAPPAAVQVLRQILAHLPALPEPVSRGTANVHAASGPAQLLPEWLSLARKKGVTVPPELVPDMLAFGEWYPEMRDAVAGAVGPRGQRLAATNPAWAYAAPLPLNLAAAWTGGTAEVRLRVLRHLRRTDPAAALPLLRSTWAAEGRDDRVAFLDALETGLSLDDEPFLESVLDEPVVEPVLDNDWDIICDWRPRPREVRPTVVNLLARLPGSRLVTGMFARLAPLLTLHEPEDDDAWIGLQLPDEHDEEELRRYGISPSLREMLAVVPPSLWSAHWGRGRAELLQAARDIGDDDLLICAWTDAAIRVRDAEYAEARLCIPGGKYPVPGKTTLAEVLPPERLEPMALERLSARRPNRAIELLDAARFPWSPALTRTVLETLPDDLPWAVRDPSERNPEIATAIVAAPYAHPATAVAVLRERGNPYEGEWVDLIHLRHTLHQAFQ